MYIYTHMVLKNERYKLRHSRVLKRSKLLRFLDTSYLEYLVIITRWPRSSSYDLGNDLLQFMYLKIVRNEKSSDC